MHTHLFVGVGAGLNRAAMSDQMLKAAQMSSTQQLALYQQELLKHYRWPGLCVCRVCLSATDKQSLRHATKRSHSELLVQQLILTQKFE